MMIEACPAFLSSLFTFKVFIHFIIKATAEMVQNKGGGEGQWYPTGTDAIIEYGMHITPVGHQDALSS